MCNHVETGSSKALLNPALSCLVSLGKGREAFRSQRQFPVFTVGCDSQIVGVQRRIQTPWIPKMQEMHSPVLELRFHRSQQVVSNAMLNEHEGLRLSNEIFDGEWMQRFKISHIAQAQRFKISNVMQQQKGAQKQQKGAQQQQKKAQQQQEEHWKPQHSRRRTVRLCPTHPVDTPKRRRALIKLDNSRMMKNAP